MMFLTTFELEKTNINTTRLVIEYSRRGLRHTESYHEADDRFKPGSTGKVYLAGHILFTVHLVFGREVRSEETTARLVTRTSMHAKE
jgi:hypothetical protein